MAVSATVYSIVIRNSSIAARFPGGMRGYAEACPNASFCTDGKLARVGFMAFDDADAYVASLRNLGFVVSEDPAASEIALLRQDKGHLLPCAWLEFGHMDGRPVAWLAGTEPTSAFIPDADLDADAIQAPFSAEELDERRVAFQRVCW